MNVNITFNRLLATVVSATLLLVALFVIGVMVGSSVSQDAAPMKLMANAAGRGENVSLATGPIANQNEGLFILDHLNGNLQCWVLNSRTNKVGGIYRTNVFDAMPNLKQGGDLDFVLTTGAFSFQGRGNQRPAESIAYVAEGKSGTLVGFGFQYDKTAIQQGVVEEGLLEVVCEGPIRDLQIREQ